VFFKSPVTVLVPGISLFLLCSLTTIDPGTVVQTCTDSILHIRAAAPAADPEIKHQERQFFFLHFLKYQISNLGTQKITANLGETMLPPCLGGFYTVLTAVKSCWLLLADC